MKILGIGPGGGTIFSEDPKVRRQTLGQLMAVVRNTHIFDDAFESHLISFVKDRNAFVHSLWRDFTTRYPGSSFRTRAALEDVESFLLSLLKAAAEMERIFLGLYVAIGRTVADREGKLSEFARVFPEWSAHEQSFRAVMSKRPPSPGPEPQEPPNDAA